MKYSLTTQCLLGLLLGIAAGAAASQLQPEAFSPWLAVNDAAIGMWTNALRLVVLPLVIAQIFVAIATHRGAKGDGTKLGLLIPGVFVGLLALSSLCTITLGSALLRLPMFADLSLGQVPAAPLTATPDPAGSAGAFAWVTSLVPSNLFEAASANSILPLMLFTLVFALASRRIAPLLLQSLETAFQAIREVMFVIVGWLLRLAPFALFALALRYTAESGLGLGGVLLAFLALWAIVLVCCIAALYPVASIGGNISLARFARAVFPAQVTAVVTRSSVATVPVLLREAETTLAVPSRISALVLPTGAAALKLSQAVSPPLRLLFLAHVLGLSIEPQQLVVFVLTIFLLSPATAGVPRVISGAYSLPAYVAAGIPPEYIILLAPLNAAADVLLTALNTTGYMTANVLVARLSRISTPASDGAPGSANRDPAGNLSPQAASGDSPY